MLAGGDPASRRPEPVRSHFLPVRRDVVFRVLEARLEPLPVLLPDFPPDVLDFPVPDPEAFFPPSFVDFAVFAVFAVFDFSSRRCRRAASTRFPTPRPSLASWVGVDVEPEIFFSGALDSEVSDEVSDVASEVSVDVDASLELSVAPDPSSRDSEAPSFEGPEDRPPTRIAAPMPIRRRSFRFRHSGQLRLGLAVIDWKSSKECPQASQT